MITAIVPARNEAERIEATLCAIGRLHGVEEVVVVDDGSTDCTSALAETAGATVVRLDPGLGKGAALQRGAEIGTGDILLLLDADLGDSACQADRLLAPVAAGEADMAIAQFPVLPGTRGGLGLVVRLARWGIRRATGRLMMSPLSGQRALRRTVWERVGGFEAGFGAEVGLTIDALQAGFRVLEVPVTMTHRVTGRDVRSILHRARQLGAVARALWKRRVLWVP